MNKTWVVSLVIQADLYRDVFVRTNEFEVSIATSLLWVILHGVDRKLKLEQNKHDSDRSHFRTPRIRNYDQKQSCF